MPRKPRTSKLPPPLESEIQRNGMAMLRARGWTVLRRNVLAMKVGKHYIKGAAKGQADTYGTTNGGIHFECEYKRPGNRPTEEQLAWLVSMNGSGDNRAVAFWVDNLDDLEQIARRVEQGWRVVYDTSSSAKPGDFYLESPESDP